MSTLEALRALDARIDYLTNLFAALQIVVDPILTGPVDAENRGQISALWGVIEAMEEALPKTRETFEAALKAVKSIG